jgi:hypothetical protein
LNPELAAFLSGLFWRSFARPALFFQFGLWTGFFCFSSAGENYPSLRFWPLFVALFLRGDAFLLRGFPEVRPALPRPLKWSRAAP